MSDRPSSLMMEAVRTSETSVDNHFTRQYIPEDNSELLINAFEAENDDDTYQMKQIFAPLIEVAGKDKRKELEKDGLLGYLRAID
jgi:hypothetical protein